MTILAWHNQIESATLTSDTTWSATLPITNLQNYLLPKVARTINDTPFTLTATFASAVSVGCVFLANHNLGRLSTVQIKSYNGVTLVNDSGAMVVYPQRTNVVVPDAEIATLRHDFCYFLPQNSSIDKVEVIVTPTAASYVQIGRLFIGETYEPSGGVDYGDQPLTYKDLSEIKTMPRGTKYAYQQQKIRSVDLTLKYMPESEAFENLLNAQRRLGLSGEVIYSQFGRQTLTSVAAVLAQNTTFFAGCFVANFVDLNPLNQQFYQGYNTQLKLLEVAI